MHYWILSALNGIWDELGKLGMSVGYRMISLDIVGQFWSRRHLH